MENEEGFVKPKSRSFVEHDGDIMEIQVQLCFID